MTEEFDGLYGKIKKSKSVVKEALEEFDNPVIGFTGGKDSTLVLWLVKEVCEEEGFEKPRAMFIDHGQHFEAMEDYVDDILDDWGFEKKIASNLELISNYDIEETVNHRDLPRDQQEEIEDNFPEKHAESSQRSITFDNGLNNKIGNHMLKTYPMNKMIESDGHDAVINGIRWDEHDSRSDEDYFSPRDDPDDHVRVHPILHITERDVWDITWFRIVPMHSEWVFGYPEEGATLEDLRGWRKSVNQIVQVFPVAPKYFEGYRSIGSETQTGKSSETAAWHQDLTEGTERENRAQQKDDEDAMTELREKGYMVVPILTIFSSKIAGGAGVLV